MTRVEGENTRFRHCALSAHRQLKAGESTYIDGKQLTNQLLLMETVFKASWSSNIEVTSLNKNQVQRKFGKLIIGKTTGYAARWLYRLLKRYCKCDEE